MTSPWPTLDACFRDCTGSRKLNNPCMQNRTEMVKDLTLKARFSQEQCFPLHLSCSPTSSAVLSENITRTVPWGQEGKDTVPGVSSARTEFQMSQKPLCGNVPLWWASRFLYLYLPGPEELPRSRQKLWLQSAKTSPQTNLSNWKHSWCPGADADRVYSTRIRRTVLSDRLSTRVTHRWHHSISVVPPHSMLSWLPQMALLMWHFLAAVVVASSTITDLWSPQDSLRWKLFLSLKKKL